MKPLHKANRFATSV